MPNLISDMARSFRLPRLKQAAGVVTRRLPIPQPVLLVGPGAAGRLGRTVGDFGHHKVMLVTDADVARLGLHQTVLDALAAAGTPVLVFDAVTPDAPIANFSQCHVGIIGHLDALGELPALMEPAQKARKLAADMLAFFVSRGAEKRGHRAGEGPCQDHGRAADHRTPTDRSLVVTHQATTQTDRQRA